MIHNPQLQEQVKVSPLEIKLFVKFLVLENTNYPSGEEI
jgi:hypothetical protein